MRKESVNKLVLLLLVLGISLLFLSMIKQFLMPIFMAGLFSALASPLHRWVTKKLNGRKNLASVLVVFGIVALVLIPLGLLITVVVAQAISVGQSVTPWVEAFINEPGQLTTYLQDLPYYDHIVTYRAVIIEKAGQMVGNISSFLIDSLSSVTKLTVHALFSSIIMLYVMFYFLTSGKILLERILYFLPLQDRDEQVLLKRFTSVASATMKGTLIIGIMQGSICGLAFALADIQGPVFWGTVMAVMSIVPAFGTAIIWFPAVLILAVTGDYSGVVILLIVCGAVAGNLDNVFGILGIILGPIVAALFITLWEIYGNVFHAYLPAVGVSLTSLEQEETEQEENQE